jgi:hypothetical protein
MPKKRVVCQNPRGRKREEPKPRLIVLVSGTSQESKVISLTAKCGSDKVATCTAIRTVFHFAYCIDNIYAFIAYLL